MARDPTKAWGDPKWHMRRMFVIAICLFGAVAFFIAASIENPEKIRALGDFFFSLSPIFVLVASYLGIAEAGQVIREIKAPPQTRVTTTVEEVKKGPALDAEPPKPPPSGWGVS